MPTPRYSKKKWWLEPDWTNQKLLPAYYLALGRFIRQFGQTEASMAGYLREFSHMVITPHVEQTLRLPFQDLIDALIGGKRIPEVRASFQTMLQVENKRRNDGPHYDLKEFKIICDHLGEIHFLRDRIAHYATQPELINGVVYMRNTNANAVRDKFKAEEVLFRIEHLDQAYYDLIAITHRLKRLLYPERYSKLLRGKRAYVNGEALPIAGFYKPWRYKPSELKKRRPKYLRNLQPPPRQPQSSQG